MTVAAVWCGGDWRCGDGDDVDVDEMLETLPMVLGVSLAEPVGPTDIH